MPDDDMSSHDEFEVKNEDELLEEEDDIMSDEPSEDGDVESDEEYMSSLMNPYETEEYSY